MLQSIIDSYFHSENDVVAAATDGIVVNSATIDEFANFFFLHIANIGFYRETMNALARARTADDLRGLAQMWLRVEWLPILPIFRDLRGVPRAWAGDLHEEFLALWKTLKQDPRINYYPREKRATIFAHFTGHEIDDVIAYCEQYVRCLVVPIFGLRAIDEYFARNGAHMSIAATARTWSVCQIPTVIPRATHERNESARMMMVSDVSGLAMAYIPRDYQFTITCAQLRAALGVPCEPSNLATIGANIVAIVRINEAPQMKLSQALAAAEVPFVQCCMWRFIAGYSGSSSARIFALKSAARLIMLNEDKGHASAPDKRVERLFAANRDFYAQIAREWQQKLAQWAHYAQQRARARADGLANIGDIDNLDGLIREFVARADILANKEKQALFIGNL